MNDSLSDSDEPPPKLAKQIIAVSLEIPEWKKLLRQSLTTSRQLAEFFSISETELKQITAKYPARINPYYASLVKAQGDAIYKQCVPDMNEILDEFGEEDPLHEEPEHQQRHNVPSLLTHRYPDRVLFRISNQCAMFCRFCTRKRKVGDINKNPKWGEILQALKYIKEHEEIRDVLLSGGDPLMLDDKVLEKIIKAVHDILKHRKYSIIRLGTRIPCALPQRITPELCSMLKNYQPIYINTHFNHPVELTAEARKACAILADAGIPLGSQTVLLKGVNDNPETMKELMQGLLAMRVKPYYIYQADPVKGTNHFRTKVQTGLNIIKSIRGFTSGLCVPHFVIDAPGGGGKVPITPDYLVDLTDDKVVLRNYEDKVYEYEQVEDY